MEKGKFRLADPNANYEVEPGGKVLSGSGVFSLELNARTKEARKKGVLVPVRDDGGTNSGAQAVTLVPPITELDPNTSAAPPSETKASKK